MMNSPIDIRSPTTRVVALDCGQIFCKSSVYPNFFAIISLSIIYLDCFVKVNSV